MTSPPPPVQILVVDDELAIREFFTEVLHDEACTVATAVHGADALDYLHQAPTLPKVILLDVRMPVMDGIRFLRAKQAEPLLKDIPVVLLSANLQHQSEVMDLPIAAFLPKPVDYDHIAAIAHHYCDA